MHVEIAGLFKYDVKPNGYTRWDENAVAGLNRICIEEDAKIVINSCHNWTGAAIMAATAFENGFANVFHPSIMTRFPDDVDNRMHAITDWIERNVPMGQALNWIVIDDMPVCGDENKQVTINLKEGLTDEKLAEAQNKLRHHYSIEYREANTGPIGAR